MKTGPKPLNGIAPLSAAERQARYRAKRATAAPAPVVKYKRPADRRSRPQQWADAVATLVALQAEYQEWLDALPESLREDATGQALEAICEIDLSDLESSTPPRGFGRDG